MRAGLHIFPAYPVHRKPRHAGSSGSSPVGFGPAAGLASDLYNYPERFVGRVAAPLGAVMDVMWTEKQPYMVLVDDDVHSARLLTRMLLAHGAPSIEWIDNADAGLSKIKIALSGRDIGLPGLVIVDLKSSSNATRDFVAEVSGHDRRRDIPLAAMAPVGDRSSRERLLGAGAHAVFERHFDLHDYRAEAAAMVRFWVRNQHLEAVGT